MKFSYDGERTYDPELGLLEPGMQGDGPDAIVALKIQAGLLVAVDEDALATRPAAGDNDTQR